MDIGKGMNFSKLRNKLTGFFTGIRGFWISIGAIFLILLILFFVFIFPLSNQYAKTCKDLDDLTIPLENYALKVKNIYNGKWITSKKLETDLYEKELEKCKTFLKEKDNRLESVFFVEDSEKGLVKIEDEALWKNEYVKRVSELLTKLEANNIVFGEGALPFHDWGSDIPTWDTILPVQKKFWILEALTNIASNNAGITRFEKITFRESSFIYDPSFAQYYTVIPLTIKVELQADRIKFLLHEILKSDIPFVIEGINILSTDKTFNSNSLMENANILANDTDNRFPNPIIDVTLEVHVIDCKT
ncbi:MAG: hypothetical protein HZA47_12375 [Planctomycetes bacterium]|uniref:hypothetical protein n=1 Tax=Candidatus Wunengus sp. YC65 TaxID=3367701 RepID=UPI001D7D4264|nr:hypothetical protein [Planctomycetota bacterium]